MDNSITETQRQHPLANYQFSSDELRVLRECNTESLLHRSLPLASGFGVATYFCVKHGYFRPNVKYGAMPKVVLGIIVGYFIGKFSYQQKCAEKLMRLPNSKLAEVLRQRKQGGVMERLTPDQSLSVGLALAPFSPNTSDIYSNENQNESLRSSPLDLDTESRPTISGLDDIYRPSLDTSTNLEPELLLEPAKAQKSYDELRKQNREEYIKKQQNPFARPLPSEVPLISRKNETSKVADKSSAQTNKYGDSWTD